jgi:hypothetical protein
MTDATIHAGMLVRYNSANYKTSGTAATVLDISPNGLRLVGGWPNMEGSMRSRSMVRAQVALIAVATMCLVVATPAAGQSDYTFTVVTDFANTDCSTITSPVLNNNGHVAFWAVCGNAIVVRRSDGTVLTPIHSYSFGTSGYIPDNPVSINDEGMVAFRARDSQSTRQVILVGSGNGLTPVVDTSIHTQYRDILLPAINASGAVAFMAITSDVNSYDSVVVVDSGSFVTIAEPGTVSPLGSLVGGLYPGRLNSSGVVTFIGQLETTFGLFTGAGGPLTTISSGGSESTLNGINTSGRVSFIGLSGNQYAVQSGEGGATTTIATNADGYLNLTGATSINDSGTVAFWAQLNSGETGIFTGPDPETDRVITTGVPLPGLGAVTAVWQITTEALNNAGQVAFGVTYDAGDGVPKWALIRADPTTDPTNGAPVASNGTASVAAGGSVSGTLSATDPDGDALTYAIVADGTKGTAIVTDSSTGAFTYTANSGASGEDTFTFQATDNHGAASNLAVVTVTIQPPPACATDVTGSVAVTAGNLRLDKKTGHYVQKVTLKNTSSAAIAGPISFVLDSLTPGAALVGAAGVTSCAAPAGSPYVNVNVGSDSLWSARERTSVGLEFTLEFAAPGATPITYTPRVLAGTGGR